MNIVKHKNYLQMEKVQIIGIFSMYYLYKILISDFERIYFDVIFVYDDIKLTISLQSLIKDIRIEGLSDTKI